MTADELEEQTELTQARQDAREALRATTRARTSGVKPGDEARRRKDRPEDVMLPPATIPIEKSESMVSNRNHTYRKIRPIDVHPQQ